MCSHVKMAAEVRSRSKEKLDRQVRHMRDCVENACKKHGAGFRFDTTYPYASFRVEDVYKRQMLEEAHHYSAREVVPVVEEV